MEILKQISQSLQQGDADRVGQLTQQAIDAKLGAQEILDNGLIAGMAVVGAQFRDHDIFLPDVLLAAKAMYAGLEWLQPLLVEEGVPRIAKVVVGSVKGDLHDIGKNLVKIMLNGAGFEVIDLGIDVAPERFVDAASEAEASVIGMSALLTTTMPMMKRVVELVDERGLRTKVKTIVGGAPVSEEFAREIGADGYGFDAANAVERVKTMVEAAG